MAQNDSIAANTAMIQEVLKRMGIQGRITLDSAKRLIEKIEQEALRRNKPSVIASMQPGWKSGCGSCDGWIFSCKL